jgi:hypothetical protein
MQVSTYKGASDEKARYVLVREGDEKYEKQEESVVENAISFDNLGENADQVSILTNEIGSIARALDDTNGTG